jgi:hypothetical protein
VTSNVLMIDQGDTETLDIACKQANHTSLAIDGTKLWFYVKRSPVDADNNALIRKTTDDGEGVTVTDAANGIAEVAIDPSDTAGLPSWALGRMLSWQLQAKDGLGRVTTLAKGDFLINRDLITTTL